MFVRYKEISFEALIGYQVFGGLGGFLLMSVAWKGDREILAAQQEWKLTIPSIQRVAIGKAVDDKLTARVFSLSVTDLQNLVPDGVGNNRSFLINQLMEEYDGPEREAFLNAKGNQLIEESAITAESGIIPISV
ncbi:hypothetical protein ABKA04_001331 [Annulohypoxylon sp. FPYF3050]